MSGGEHRARPARGQRGADADVELDAAVCAQPSETVGPAPAVHRDPPVVRRLTIDSSVAAPGLPVQVTWFVAGADTVHVDGTDFPGQIGTAHVLLDRTRQIEVVASNAVARVTAWTEVVVVLPLPRITAVELPAPPPVRLHADVTATLSAGLGAVAARDELHARQDLQRPPGRPALAGHVVPSSLTSFLGRQRTELPGWDDAVHATSTGARTRRRAHRPEGPARA